MENREKMYIRGNVDVSHTECKNCNKRIAKNDCRQIVYYCSKKCRKKHKRIKDDIISNSTIDKGGEFTPIT